MRAGARRSETRTELESSNFSFLDDLLYQGRQDRLDRYRVYDAMDQDVDIARALDMIAEHCTNTSDKTGIPFEFDLDEDEITTEDVSALYGSLDSWASINEWDKMLFRTVRNVVKYGDAFFIRDPNSFKLHAVAAKQVAGIFVDKNSREIEGYLFRDLNFLIPEIMNFGVPQVATTVTAATIGRGVPAGEMRRDAVVAADHVVHISLSEGRHTGGNGQHDDIWPFGESFLEQVYRDFRKRDLLESAALVHRMQRAPTRRIWYIDVGKMKPTLAKQYLRKLKDEILHKRVPTKFGGDDAMDAVYNPISQLEDIWLPQMAGGRGSKVENLEGQQWNGLEDLEYFNSKVNRGLRIPTSFLLGPEEGGATYNDGRVGTAYIQEIQFGKFCQRIQKNIDNPFDFEFKMYMKSRGIQVNSGDFAVVMTPPMNFEEYRQAALDSDRLNRMGTANGFPFVAKRTVLQRYGGLTHDEVIENEKDWAEENLKGYGSKTAQDGGGGGLSVGGGLDFGGPAPTAPGLPDSELGQPPGELGADGAQPVGQDGGITGVPAPGAGGGAPTGGAGGFPEGMGAFSKGKLLVEGDGRPTELGRAIMYSAKKGTTSNRTVVSEVLARNRQLKEADRRRLEESAEASRKDRSKAKKPVDMLFAMAEINPEEVVGRVPITLKHLRTLRLEKETGRRSLVKRMRQVARMYGGAGEASQPF